MEELRVFIQRASEDNYSFITNKGVEVMTKDKFLEFLLTGLKAGDKFILKPGNEDIDVSLYYYDFLT